MIGLVACSKQKLDRRAPARELYSSRLFRMSLEYAERRCQTVYVASALHGLIALDRVLDPYDFSMDQRTKDERILWGAYLVRNVAERHGEAFDVLVMAGTLYAWPIIRALHTRIGWRGEISEPMAGMQIGERLSFLSHALEAA